MRWGQVRDQYDSPMFRRHCQSLAAGELEQALEYRRSGYQVLGFIMVDGSPVCGLKKTPQPALEGQVWGGMTRYIPRAAFCMWSRRVLRDPAGRGSAPGPGRHSVCEHARGARRRLVRGCAASRSRRCSKESDRVNSLERLIASGNGEPIDCVPVAPGIGHYAAFQARQPMTKVAFDPGADGRRRAEEPGSATGMTRAARSPTTASAPRVWAARP